MERLLEKQSGLSPFRSLPAIFRSCSSILSLSCSEISYHVYVHNAATEPVTFVHVHTAGQSLLENDEIIGCMEQTKSNCIISSAQSRSRNRTLLRVMRLYRLSVIRNALKHQYSIPARIMCCQNVQMQKKDVSIPRMR